MVVQMVSAATLGVVHTLLVWMLIAFRMQFPALQTKVSPLVELKYRRPAAYRGEEWNFPFNRFSHFTSPLWASMHCK